MGSELLQLYDPEIERIISILNALEHVEQEISLRELTHQLDMGEKTLLRYSERIAFFIKQSKVASIHFRLDDHFIKWEIEDINEYRFLRNFIVQQCAVVQLGVRLILGKRVNRIQFMDEFYLSESTLKRRLSTMRKLLASYALTIKTSQGELELVGEEAIIRRLARDSLMNLYESSPWPFELVDEQQVDQFIEETFELAEFKYKTARESEVIQTIKYDIAIQMTRVKLGYKIKLSSILAQNLELIEEIVQKQLIPTYHFRLSNTEHAYLVFQILAKDFFYMRKKGEQVLQLMRKLPLPLNQFLQTAITYFSNQIVPIARSDYKELYPFFITIHLNDWLFPNWINSIHYRELDIRVPRLMSQLANYLKKLEQTYPQHIIGPIEVLQRNYGKLVAYLTSLSFRERKINVGFYGARTILEIRTAENIVRESFSYLYNISFDYDAPDIMIHLNQYEHRVSKQTHEKLIRCFVTSAFLVEDMSTIRQALFDFFNKK
ncbi:helix-turn-helix domain-containing protein [Enterococcus bulliens]